MGETAQTLELAEGMKFVFAAGDYFVGVCLVSHIPDDPVPGCVEDVMEGQGQLHGAQVGGEVAAVY